MKGSFKIIKAKFLRRIGINKPIELSNTERHWIKLIKGHYLDKYAYTEHWIESLKPMFIEIYGWEPDEHYLDYLDCIFDKLLKIYLKIKHDQSGHEVELIELFRASFYKSISYEYEKPIERAIAKVCSLINLTTVYENGIYRFIL